MDGPYFVGGDFNILRHCLEKNKPTVLPHSSEVFNSVIHSLSLRKIFMKGGFILGQISKKNPTLERLDRVLMSSEWEDLFPLVYVQKVVREQSDHNVLLVDSGDNQNIERKREFRFDNNWLKNPDFLPLVKSIWENL